MNLRETPRFLTLSIVILFIAVAILYIGFHGRYMAEYLDDAWVLSWAWNLYEHGEVRDTVFGEQGGGTVHFQRTVAIVYGAVASLLGWSRGVGYGVSKIFVVGAALCWFFIIRKLGYRRAVAWTFVGLMLVLEGYFGIANKIRQEPIALFLCSASFLLFLHRRYLLSGLFLGIAVETHPFAFTGAFWVLAYLVVLWPDIAAKPKTYTLHAFTYIAGLALGFGYWLLFHAAYIGEVGTLSKMAVGNVFGAYYFTHRYAWRHWPELAMILIGALLFIIRKKHHDHPFVLPFLVAVVLASLTISRGNIHYIVYLYPAAILLLLTVAEDLRLTPLLIVAVLLFQLPQYAWLFWDQREYHHRTHLRRLTEAVPEGVETIYGHPNAWFAFKDRDFHGYGYFGRSALPLDEWPESFIVIETSDFGRWNGESDMVRGNHRYIREDLAEWTYWDGEPLSIYRLHRK